MVFVTAKLWFRLCFEMVLFPQSCLTNLVFLENNFLKSGQMLAFNRYNLKSRNLMVVDRIPRQCDNNCTTGTNLTVAH